MADRWMDERDRDRDRAERDRDDRDWRRQGHYSRDQYSSSRDQYGGGRQPERRSFEDRDDYGAQGSSYEGDGGYEGGRDAVFGETGDYTRYGTTNPYRGERLGGGSAGSGSTRSMGSAGGGGRGGWQDPDYGGVSPAMRRGGYGRGRFQGRGDAARYGRGSGGRFYGDDARESVYREEYGVTDFGYRGGGDDPGYSRTRDDYHAQGYGRSGYTYGPGEEIRREMRHEAAGGPYSGGNGGYDYERGYGDAGRGEDRGARHEDRGERFERAGRGAGDFLHRAGEKVASWFSGGDDRGDDRDWREGRGARGMGPKGYKRSDERISDDAHDRLTDDSWLDASNISVSVSGGEVTLSGTVDNREAKHRAERVVEDIPGVSHVQNNLRIERSGFLRSDSTGYGDSVAEAQMRRDEPATNGTGGAGGGQSTAGRKS